jgi:hypothetical protein
MSLVNICSIDEYMKNYSTFTKKMVYRFKKHNGGIGDFIKYFMYALTLSMKYNIQLYLENNYLDNYIKLKYPNWYINNSELTNTYDCNYHDMPNLKENIHNIVEPTRLYYKYNNGENLIYVQDIFYFSDEVISNSIKLHPYSNNYISIHLRLGDKFLVCNTQSSDSRVYNENNIFKIIEDNKNEQILFFCDNNDYKLKIKNKYNYVNITESKIVHTAELYASEEQILDTISEFYLITQSTKIYAGSISGFSIVASHFKKVPFILV